MQQFPPTNPGGPGPPLASAPGLSCRKSVKFTRAKINSAVSSFTKAQPSAHRNVRYTAFMTRLTFASVVLALFSLTATAQVKIHVSARQHKKYEAIHASVENSGTNPVTFCIEYGQTSPNGSGEIETTPSPFWVQQNNSGKWGTLMIGPDVGSFKSPEVLDPHKSVDFHFRLADSGQMRLRLNYWRGSLPSLDCHEPPKGAKLVTSAVFDVE